MTDAPESLIYLYGIVPADAPDAPVELVGLENAPVEVLRVGDVGALVSRLPAAVYDDEALNARLDDLAWVGERGLAHERVLDWYVDRGPVIPLSLFSLHRDETRMEARVEVESAGFRDLLERLRGRREWGIKLWRREAEAREGIDALSPSLQELGRQIDEAPEGKRFLLVKKRDALRAEEIRTVSKRIAHEMYAELRKAAVDAASIPIPSGAAGGERVLLLHAAFLVADAEFDEFQAAVNAQSGRIAGSGFEIEFTGPWSPYHFSEPDDE